LNGFARIADRDVAAEAQPIDDVGRICDRSRFGIGDGHTTALQFSDAGNLGVLDAGYVRATSPTRGQQRSGDRASRRFSDLPKQDLIPDVGDRVSEIVDGKGNGNNGTVVKKAGGDRLMVRYDTGEERVADPDDLQRLIYGDVGYKNQSTTAPA
jgi:hypothetical protein